MKPTFWDDEKPSLWKKLLNHELPINVIALILTVILSSVSKLLDIPFSIIALALLVQIWVRAMWHQINE